MPSQEETFDYIVVGAGSAGCVLANRLSAGGALSVLLVEAGGAGGGPMMRIPLLSALRSGDPRLGWNDVTAPQAGLAGRRLPWPRAKLLGGCSAVNGMVHGRGHRADYDGWAALGLDGWSYEEVLPYFRRMERHEGGASGLHGGDGPLPVTRPGALDVLSEVFVAAARQAGLPVAQDFNAPEPEGVGRFDFNIAGGQRWSGARAYLAPAARRPNLSVRTGLRVLKVRVAAGRAVGVEVLDGGAARFLRARREVVLACGTVNTPALLMHSGIGEAERLRALGVAVVADRREVGQNLRDPLAVHLMQGCTRPVSLFRYTRPDRAAAAFFQAAVLSRGPLTRMPMLAGAFLRSEPGLAAPDLQVSFMPTLLAPPRRPFQPSPAPHLDRHGFSLVLNQTRPESRGHVTIASDDPLQPPVIQPQYLSSPVDRAALRRGMRILRELVAQPAFDPYRDQELAPGAAIQSDDELDAVIARTAATSFHPVGSCRMGADPDSVLDPELRVRGVEGLRVADASVMPRMVAAATHAPTVMIAEKASDLILASEGGR